MRDWIRDLIIAIDGAGLRGDMYSLINTAALISAVLFGFFHGRKLKVGIIVILFSIAVERAVSSPLMSLILFVENGFVSTGKQNGVVVFAYVPMIGFLVSKVLKRPWKEIWDIMMPVPLAMFAGARIACTITGCCYGYPCSWGVYNIAKDDFLFPIQLLESFVAVVILLFLNIREKMNNNIPDGCNVPIVLISYGVARFFLEFLHDNKKIFMGCASTSFHCMFMVLVGVIALNIINRSEKKRAIVQ